MTIVVLGRVVFPVKSHKPNVIIANIIFPFRIMQTEDATKVFAKYEEMMALLSK